MADNFYFRVECGSLEASLKLAFSNHSKAWGYYSDEKELVLFWTDSNRGVAFPSPLTCEEVLPIVKSWLNSKANYGKSPDIDGDAERSWIVENGPWSFVSDFGWESFVRITPHWALYGK